MSNIKKRITEYGEIVSSCSVGCCRYYKYYETSPICIHKNYPGDYQDGFSYCPLEQATIVEIVLYDNFQNKFSRS